MLPVTAATVSVSPPRSITARIACSNVDVVRTAHSAWPTVVHTDPLPGSPGASGSNDPATNGLYPSTTAASK